MSNTVNHNIGTTAEKIGLKNHDESDVTLFSTRTNTGLIYILVDEDQTKEASTNLHTVSIEPGDYYVVEKHLEGVISIISDTANQSVMVTS